MNITIQQTLHGYQNGHQMLANSIDLPNDIKKTLLFQSDLSGPTFYPGFEVYITGYPIPSGNFYALAKTWYADEMPRPGCVWTHTLLINYADLSKIPELSILENYFHRPQLNDYDAYETPIVIEDTDMTVSRSKPSAIYDELVAALYGSPNATILVRADETPNIDKEFYQIWSDQWPRLRRSFSFCSGALSFKENATKAFDLLGIPSRNTRQIMRQEPTALIVGELPSQKPEWLEVLHQKNNLPLRHFLWSFGSDVAGTRANYPILIDLFSRLQKNSSTLSELGNYIGEIMPDPKQGRSFKLAMFGKNSSFKKFSEKEIITYLITSPVIDFVEYGELAVEERLESLIHDGKFTTDDLLKLWVNRQPERVNLDIVNALDLNNIDLEEIFSYDQRVASDVVNRLINSEQLSTLWQTSPEIQRTFVRAIRRNFPDRLPVKYVVQILKANKSLLYDFIEIYPNDILDYLFDLCNDKQEFDQHQSLIDELIITYKSRFYNWISKNKDSIGNDYLMIIFNIYNQDEILRLPFSHHAWIKYYGVLTQIARNELPYISAIVLAKGFADKIYGSEWIVAMVFKDVYHYAANGSLQEAQWRIIPKDYDDGDDEDYSLLEAFYRFLTNNPKKKKKDIPDWDYCEVLIRTLVSKFVKTNWSPQAFLDALSNEEMFRRALAFMITSNNGRNFLRKIENHLKKKKIKGRPFQLQIFDRLNG